MPTKTRVAVRYDGKLRSLFSIEEKLSGDLLIGMTAALNFAEISHFDSKILSHEHISIHSSPNSKGFTVTHTTVLENVRELKSAIFIKNAANSGFYPIFQIICNKFKRSRIISHLSKDKIMRLHPFRGKDNISLTYIILVANKFQKFPNIDGFSRLDISFREFKLCIYYCYIDVPPSDFGFRHSFMTSALRINGAPSFNYNSDGSEFMDTNEIENFLKYSTVEIFKSNFRAIGIIIPKMSFHAKPIDKRIYSFRFRP